LQAGRFLFEKGFYVQSVTFPAVPYHAGVLRIQVNANHQSAAIDGLVAGLAALQRQFALPTTADHPERTAA
jgi:7-keto-8-aminopelargonate synthetase-like enzyme